MAFGVARATHASLSVANVFYAIALLRWERRGEGMRRVWLGPESVRVCNGGLSLGSTPSHRKLVGVYQYSSSG